MNLFLGDDYKIENLVFVLDREGISELVYEAGTFFESLDSNKCWLWEEGIETVGGPFEEVGWSLEEVF